MTRVVSKGFQLSESRDYFFAKKVGGNQQTVMCAGVADNSILGDK
jgi:hypothetical protein